MWIKLYDHDKRYIDLVDKYKVKEYVAGLIGKEHIVPTLGCWKNANNIDFNQLPRQFVLKCTHDSGSVIICRDKTSFSVEDSIKKLNKALKHKSYRYSLEWPYKYVTPQIIAEPYLEDSTTHDLRDYKYFAFDGKVEALFIATDRQNDLEETKFDFFDKSFNHLDVRQGHPNSSQPISKPKNFEKMIEYASILSKGFKEVRVDFYEVDGKVFFGELTFFHHGGTMPFDPPIWDEIFGEWIQL